MSEIAKTEEERYAMHPDYAKIVATIKDMPATFYPAILCQLVEAGYAKSVFMPGGASSIARLVELRLGKEKA